MSSNINLTGLPGFIDPRESNLVPDASGLAGALGQMLGRKREEKKQAEMLKAQKLQKDFKTTGAQMLRIRDIEDFTTQRKELAILGQQAISQGEDPTLFTEGLNINNPDEMNLFLTRTATAAGNADKLISQGLTRDETIQTEQRKEATKIRSEERNAERERLKAEDDSGVSEVQSAKIMDSGVVQIVRKDGTVEVKEPEAVAADVVRRAEERGVDLQQRRSQGRELGKDAAKVASKLFDSVGKMRANNRTLKKVITEVGNGADTGPLASRLPSIRAASVRLDQLRNELGLDVVGAVTFGALSEGELNLAMSTALPDTLDGPELAQWAKDKIEAQEKLINYMEDQAIFLSEKGNTPAMWLESQRQSAPKVQREAVPQANTFTLPNGVIVERVQ